jgi:glyoxalase family protein
MRSAGIHHITAIAGDPQTNLDFYAETLGLRFVKRTVNFDDPGSYHFYFGDNIGSPGTIITFFPWPGARRGTRGSGQVTSVSFAIPRNSIVFWKEQLRANHVVAEEISDRFGNKALRFLDPDGLMLELMESPVIPSEGRMGHSIRGFAAPTLEVRHLERTEKLLIEILGFEFVGEESNRRRLRGSGSNTAAEVDLVSADIGFGLVAVGSVHHIAFRVVNDEEQLRVRERLVERGLDVTPVIDRQYFHSIYFREPNGILFEVATDGPGFLIDESADQLGESLKLPSMY